MTLHLRVAEMRDIPAIEQLIPASVRGLSVGYYSPDQIESALRYVFGPDNALIQDGTYFVVEREPAAIVACGGWSRRRTLYGGNQAKKGPDDLLDSARDAARIRAFFVHPDHARQGIGRMLMEQCLAAARAEGFGAIELGSTLPGVPLYTAFGFAAVRDDPVPMPDGVTLPIVVMRREL